MNSNHINHRTVGCPSVLMLYHVTFGIEKKKRDREREKDRCEESSRLALHYILCEPLYWQCDVELCYTPLAISQVTITKAMAFTAHCNALAVFYHFLLDSTLLCSAQLCSVFFFSFRCRCNSCCCCYFCCIFLSSFVVCMCV